MAYWTKLVKLGEWGLNLEPGDEARPGAVVIARKKDGTTSEETLLECFMGGLWRIQPKQRAPQAANGAPLPPVTQGEAQTARAALLAKLDSHQQQVAAWRPGRGANLRVVAAAGSGKTTTTVATVTNLLAEGVDPASLVITTFTSKAGKELNERLRKVVDPAMFDRLTIGTFHGIALRALRQNAPEVWGMGRCVDTGRSRNRDIPAASTLWIRAFEDRAIQILGGEQGLSLPKEEVGEYRLAVEALCLSRGYRYNTAEGKELADKSGLPQLHAAWSLYERQKAAHGAFDFSDALITLRDGLRASAPGNRVVIVDEAQDNSALQIELAELLAGTGSVVLVGDVRQSIYGWRGAAPDLFLSADTRINARTLYLPTNYRSGRKIVELGNKIAEGQSWTLGPACGTGRDVDGTITVRGFSQDTDRADAIGREVRGRVDGGDRPDSFAVLCRTRAEQGPMEAALLRHKVPVAIVGGSSFFAGKAWKDYAALLLAADGGKLDNDTAKRAAESTPGVGFYTARDVATAYGSSGDILAAVASVAENTRRRNQREGLMRLHALLRECLTLKFTDICEKVGTYLAAFKAADEKGDNDERGEITSSAQLAATFDTAEEAVKFAAKCEGAALALGDDAGEGAEAGRVCISTIHKAKGREWTTVYADASGGRFPHARSENNEQRMAEERRLFYVAVTRAADNLHLTYCAEVNEKPAGPSEFLDFVETDKPTGGGERVPEVKRIDGGTVPLAAVADEIVEKHHGLDFDAELAERLDQVIPELPAVAGLTPQRLQQRLSKMAVYAPTLTERGAQPAPGQRFVPVTLEEFQTLLEDAEFKLDDEQSARSGQHALSVTLAGGSRIIVYTSIPRTGELARGLGEDSIRFSILSPAGKPLLKRQPYSARTKNWRSTVVSRLQDLVSRFAGTCEKCGGLTCEKQSKDAGRVFQSCVRFPECNGYARA